MSPSDVREPVRWIASLLVSSAVVVACGAQVALDDYEVVVTVTTPEGQPVSGAAIHLVGSPRGGTDAAGRLRLSVRARPGTRFPFAVVCPAGYSPVDVPKTLRFVTTRPLAPRDDLGAVAVGAHCQRISRQIVVVVAAGQPGLPVLVDGRQVTVTNSGGYAHALLERASTTTTMSVSLDTDALSHLQPRNPGRVFDLASADGLLLFQPGLSLAPPAPRKARNGRLRRIPYRID